MEKAIEDSFREKMKKDEGDYVSVVILKNDKVEVFTDNYRTLDDIFGFINQRQLKCIQANEREIRVENLKGEPFTIKLSFPCYGEERIEDFFEWFDIKLKPTDKSEEGQTATKYIPIPQLGSYYMLEADFTLKSVPMLNSGEMDSIENEVIVEHLEREDAERAVDYLNGMFDSAFFKYDPTKEKLIVGPYAKLAPKIINGVLHLDPFNEQDKKEFPFTCNMYDGGDTGHTRGTLDIYWERFAEQLGEEDEAHTIAELKKEMVKLLLTVGDEGYIAVSE